LETHLKDLDSVDPEKDSESEGESSD